MHRAQNVRDWYGFVESRDIDVVKRRSGRQAGVIVEHLRHVLRVGVRHQQTFYRIAAHFRVALYVY